MDAILKITISRVEQGYIDSALKMVEAIKADYPDLFQQIEVVVEC